MKVKSNRRVPTLAREAKVIMNVWKMIMSPLLRLKSLKRRPILTLLAIIAEAPPTPSFTFKMSSKKKKPTERQTMVKSKMFQPS